MPAMLLVHAIFAVIVIVSLPGEAFAWGPGMHVEVAMTALSKAALIAPFIRGLILRFPEAFTYGATSPDIVVGKKYAGYFHHCHNWRMGWQILHEAKSDRERAAAYGYLTHLAADVVAHNYYIPCKVIRSYGARLLSHTYWEMRFDLGLPPEVWERLKMVTQLEIGEFDELLKRVLKKTIFSFSTNKKIFNAILKFQKLRGMRGSLSLYVKHSRYPIGIENREHYVDLTTEAVLNFLKNPETSVCLQIDPTGSEKLRYAKKIRGNIRRALRWGRIDEHGAEKFVEFLKERLALGIYRPEMKLPQSIDSFFVAFDAAKGK